MNVTPKSQAAIVRFAKIAGLGAAVLWIDGLVTLATGNVLGLAPTYQSLVMAFAIPALAAAEKWASWQEAQA